MGSVNNHRIGWSPLSNQINLYRHGKDPSLALEQRDALNEVLTAAMHYLMDERHPSGAVRMEFNGKVYQLSADDVTDDAFQSASKKEEGR